jgi:phosphate/sulfate permease
MNWSWFETVLGNMPWWLLTPVMLGGMALAAMAGLALRRRYVADTDPAEKEDDAGYVVPAVMGLLALLLGFTFALAIDRFENRRELVLAEANAIGTSYLRTQLLPEPHRARISSLLVRYADNRLKLGVAKPGQAGSLLAVNSQIITDLWAATSAAFDDIKGLDFSSSYIDSMNNLIDLDSARQAARQAHVPGKVFAMLYLYALATAAVLSYSLASRRGRVAAGVLLLLMQSALALIIDIDRPTLGGVNESQAPMIALRDSMRAQPPPVFDRFRTIPRSAP